MLFLAGVITGLLVAFTVAYWFGDGIHRRLHESQWFGPDEPFHVHTHWDDAVAPKSSEAEDEGVSP